LTIFRATQQQSCQCHDTQKGRKATTALETNTPTLALTTNPIIFPFQCRDIFFK